MLSYKLDLFINMCYNIVAQVRCSILVNLTCLEDDLRRRRAYRWSFWCLLWLPKLVLMLGVKIFGSIVMAYNVSPKIVETWKVILVLLIRIKPAMRWNKSCVQSSLLWVKCTDFTSIHAMCRPHGTCYWWMKYIFAK